MTEPNCEALNRLTPAKKIPQKFPHLFSEPQWAWMVKQRKFNGLGVAFRKIGKHLYVIEDELFEAIDSQKSPG